AFRFISERLIFEPFAARISPSIRRAAAGDVEYTAGGERALLAGEPGDKSRHLINRAETSDRDFGQHVADMLFAHLVEDGGAYGCGRYAVDGDRLFGKLLAERLCEADHCGFRRAISRS